MNFQHEIDVEAPPPAVTAFLVDLHNHRALHPLIETITDLPRPEARPTVRAYEIVDRVPMGPLRVRVTYRAEVEQVAADRIVAEAFQRPRVHLRTEYTVLATDSGSRSIEHVTVTAPFGLTRFVTAQAEKAHAATMARLPAQLQRSNDRPI